MIGRDDPPHRFAAFQGLEMDLGWWIWCLGLGKGESTGKAREGVRKGEKTVNNI